MPRLNPRGSPEVTVPSSIRYVVIDEAGLQFDLVADEQLTLVTASFPVSARTGALPRTAPHPRARAATITKPRLDARTCVRFRIAVPQADTPDDPLLSI